MQKDCLLTPVCPGGRIRVRCGCTVNMLAVSSFLHNSRIIWRRRQKREVSLQQDSGSAVLNPSSFVTRSHMQPTDSLSLSAGEAVCPAALGWAGLGLWPSPASQTHRAFHNRGLLSAEPPATSQQRAAAEEGSAASGMTAAGIYLHGHGHMNKCLLITCQRGNDKWAVGMHYMDVCAPMSACHGWRIKKLWITHLYIFCKEVPNFQFVHTSVKTKRQDGRFLYIPQLKICCVKPKDFFPSSPNTLQNMSCKYQSCFLLLNL